MSKRTAARPTHPYAYIPTYRKTSTAYAALVPHEDAGYARSFISYLRAQLWGYLPTPEVDSPASHTQLSNIYQTDGLRSKCMQRIFPLTLLDHPEHL